jgi:SPP1 family predicted phage head-tail adaptor
MMVGAGDLREKITLLREQRTPDDIGGYEITWQSLGAFWANVSPMSGQARDHAAQTETPRNYRITLRKCSRSTAIRTNDRLRWRGKTMLIHFIAESGAFPIFLVLEAEEITRYTEEGTP